MQQRKTGEQTPKGLEEILERMGEARLMRSKYDSCETPKWLYDELDKEFHFNDDPCPVDGNGGLDREWGNSTFMNPPYSTPLPWCRKAVEEMKKGKLIVGLLRGDTSTKWFHNYVLPYAELRFLKGRLRFSYKGQLLPSPAPFASIIAIWRGEEGR